MEGRYRAVLLRLIGHPFQAWGEDSAYNNRETLDFPTKSGLIGLCLAGMGVSGEQAELLEKMSRLKLTAASYVKSDADGNPILPIIYEDFQIVGGGYDNTTLWGRMNIPLNSEGHKAACGGTLIRLKQYLEGACFFAAFEAKDAEDEGLITQIAYSLWRPKFPIFLGRKNCPPGEPVFAGMYESAEEALRKASMEAEANGRKELFRIVEKGIPGEEYRFLNDVPIKGGLKPEYAYRAIWRIDADWDS